MLHHVECTYTSCERPVSTDPGAFVGAAMHFLPEPPILTGSIEVPYPSSAPYAGDRSPPVRGDASAIVVGGSIGGLTTALLLRDAGFHVTVLERSTVPLEGRGAGIVLHEATARYLVARVGLSVEAISEGARWFRFVDEAGAVTHEEPCCYRFTAWTTLFSNLLDNLPPDHYRLGHEVAGIETLGDRARVVTVDGFSAKADLVVCADGITSSSRRRLLPEVEGSYAGYLGWRGVIRESDLEPKVFDRLYEAITYATPPLSHILAYPIPGNQGTSSGRVLNYVWYRNLETGPRLDDVMTDVGGVRRYLSVAPGKLQSRHVEDLKREARSALPADLARMVIMTEQPFIQTVIDVEVPRMAFDRVCLIGDAAFAARPHAAAGTAKAAADAWSLSESLRGTGGDIPAALRSWEPAALERGRRLTERARRLGTMAQVEGTFRGGDPFILFGLDRPGDSCYSMSSERLW
jgi:2,6-dihydroxypyridine 3-monooxygenase